MTAAVSVSPLFSRRRLLLAACVLLAGCSTLAPEKPLPPAKPRIGLALGGGAARGFAHIGVIKMLEAQGIVPDYVVGTSAGAVVGSLYAGGNDAPVREAARIDAIQVSTLGETARAIQAVILCLKS